MVSYLQARPSYITNPCLKQTKVKSKSSKSKCHSSTLLLEHWLGPSGGDFSNLFNENDTDRNPNPEAMAMVLCRPCAMQAGVGER